MSRRMGIVGYYIHICLPRLLILIRVGLVGSHSYLVDNTHYKSILYLKHYITFIKPTIIPGAALHV